MAQNAPGPVAVARLVSAGATAVKVEPPSGDQLARLCKPWYDELHAHVRVERLDLKSADGIARMMTLLADADVFLASHRPSALMRLGLDHAALSTRFPALCHVNIVGDTTNPEHPGHDLTYLAQAGLLGDSMPRTLIADMAGAERTHAVVNEVVKVPGASRIVGLYDVLLDLAAPLRHGLTAPGAELGGGNAGYAIYAAREGSIAVGALEPHFRSRLFEGLGIDDGADPSAIFKSRTAAEWADWAAARDIPLVQIKS